MKQDIFSSLGWVLVEEGRISKGVAQLDQQFALKTAAGSELARLMNVPMLADAYVRAGRTAEGLRLLEDGLPVVHTTGFAMMEPDLYRSKGDPLLAHGSDEAQASACVQQAIESARQIEAKSWELRAALSLCRL